MKTQSVLLVKMLALGTLFGCVTASIRAEDKAEATGTWKWIRKTPEGLEREITGKFKQDGEKLTGKMTGPTGEVEILNGKVKDDEISFQISVERNGSEVHIKYAGKLSGDSIKGKIDLGRGQTRDWEATRVKEKKK